MDKNYFAAIFVLSLVCQVVQSGDDHYAERVYHPRVESRDLGPLMESGSRNHYSYNSGYSSYNNPSPGFHSPTSTSNRLPFSGGYNSGSNFGTSYNYGSSSMDQPREDSSYQYHKKEKEEFVNGQQVYGLHHEKEYTNGQLTKDNRLEKTPEDFKVPMSLGSSSYGSFSGYNNRERLAPVYYPSTGSSSSSSHQSSSSYSSGDRNSHSLGKNNEEDDFFQSEMKKLQQQMEERMSVLHRDYSHKEPSYTGSNHRTEIKTKVKYVNGKRVFEKSEEKKYRDGKLVHDETSEHGKEHHDISPHYNFNTNNNRYQESVATSNKPYYVIYPSRRYTSYGSDETSRRNDYNPTQYSSSSTQYYSHPYVSSSYPKSSTTSTTERRTSSSSSTVPNRQTGQQMNSGGYRSGSVRYLTNSDDVKPVSGYTGNYIPKKVYETYVGNRQPVRTSTESYERPSYTSDKEDDEDETRRYSTLNTNNNYIVPSTSFDSSKYQYSNSSQYSSRNNLYGRNSSILRQTPSTTVATTTTTTAAITTPIPILRETNRRKTESHGDKVLRISSRPYTSSSYYHDSYYSKSPRHYQPVSSTHVNRKSDSYVPGITYDRVPSSREQKQYVTSRGSSHVDQRSRKDYDLEGYRYSDTNNRISLTTNNSKKPEEKDSFAILPGVISGPSVRRGDQVLKNEEERYDISPLIDGGEDDVPRNELEDDTPSKKVEESRPRVGGPLHRSSFYGSEYGYESKTSDRRPDDYSESSAHSRINRQRFAAGPSNRIESITTKNYINGIMTKQITVYRYYQNEVLVHENTTIKTRDEMAGEGVDVYGLDLSASDLLSYGPRDNSMHYQKHEVSRVQNYRSGFPIYELNELRTFQDGRLVHSSKEEKNEDDFINANRLLIESQRRKNSRNSESYSKSSAFDFYPRGYSKKHEYHQEEEYINGKKVYHLHHEKEYEDGELVRDNKTEHGTKNLGLSTSGQKDFSQHSLVTGCLQCGSSNNRLLQAGTGTLINSFGNPHGRRSGSTNYRHDINVEEHYEDGRLVKGVEDNKKWNDGILTDAKTEHYYGGPPRTDLKYVASDRDLNKLRFSRPMAKIPSSSRRRDELIPITRKRDDQCISNPCINGGNCVNRRNNSVCICPFGFKGSRCEEAYCPSRYCRYGGKCSISGRGEHECECLEGFTGDRCNTKIYRLQVRAGS